MKNIKFNNVSRLLSACLLLIVLLTYGSCKSDDTLSAKELNTQKLAAHDWSIHSVTVDGMDQSGLFTGMTLSVDGSQYNTVNGGVVWPASGTWEFTNEEATVIQRDDGQEILIVELTDDVLKLQLNWNKSTFGEGRVSSVSGVHLFEFH